MRVFEAVFLYVTFVGTVFFAGRLMARSHADERHRRIGTYVYRWATALVATGGILGLLFPNDSYAYYYEYGGGLMGLGLILGVLFGNVHGRLRAA
ncbi:MAG TPA: hypothetical protein VM597_10230 [Gemmataceae bacterium]|jgi:hypothetical protein|nr:hypothetical protein [Gemmataceae bacterium]